MTVATLAVPAVIAVVVTLLTNHLARGREARARAVLSRRAAVLDVQQAVVRLRVERNRYGTEITHSLAAREPGAATSLDAPHVPADVEQALYEADSVFGAAMARLDARENPLRDTVETWNDLAKQQSLTREVDAAAEQTALDQVNAAVRTALADIGA